MSAPGPSLLSSPPIEALSIILSGEKAKGILVNVLGGIAKCDLIAEALVKACQQTGLPALLRPHRGSYRSWTKGQYRPPPFAP